MSLQSPMRETNETRSVQYDLGESQITYTYKDDIYTTYTDGKRKCIIECILEKKLL